jgi:DNA polymerase III subunit delta
VKIAPGKIEQFIAKPGSAVRAVLVYGPDAGLVRERSDALMRTAVADLSDPFLVAELTGDAIARDPALLADEAAAIALTGGRRAVRVRDAGDAHAGAVKSMLAGPAGDTLVVLLAGELGPRSALRKLIEDADAAAAVPCYADEIRDLDRVIRETLAADGLSVSPDASAYLAANLGSDRGVTRSELQKLALYAGGNGARGNAAAGGQVELADAVAVVGDSAALSLDDLCFAAIDGDMAAADRALERSLQEGQSEVAILRAVSRHLMRLQLTVGRIDRGEAPERAVKSLRPPVFFKREPQFRRQAESWSGARIAQALDLVQQAELSCKSTGIPAAAVCGRTLLQIAALARQARRARRG